MKRIFSILALTFMIGTFFVPAASAQELTDAQKAEVKKLFDEYLSESGSAIIDSVNKFQEQQMEEQQKAASEKAKVFMADLDKTPNLAMTGNPEGDITIVEFFDYNCGYCRKALAEVEKLLETEKNAKVVFIDMPILGPASMEASKWSVAAINQEKYFEYHRAIMNHNGPKNEPTLVKLAQDLDLDVDQLKKDKESKEVAAIIQANLDKARELGIQGTPGFIIESEVVRGYVTADQMKETIASFRE